MWRHAWFRHALIAMAIIAAFGGIKGLEYYHAPNTPLPGSTQALLSELDENGHEWRKELQPVSRLFADLKSEKVSGVVVGDSSIFVKTGSGERYSVSDSKGLIGERLVADYGKDGSGNFPLTTPPQGGVDLFGLFGHLVNALFVVVFLLFVKPLLETFFPFKVQRGGTDVSFKDVVGCHSAKEALFDIIQSTEMRRAYQKAGATPPKGVLMVGPPGTGKTLLAKALATECGLNFIAVSGSDFTKPFVGAGVLAVRQLFKTARDNAPCIVFIDEIDGIGARRQGGDSVDAENNRIINRFLVEMDGFDNSKGVYIIGATNFGSSLDPAMMREGRFDRTVEVSPPNHSERMELLTLYTSKLNNLEAVDFEEVSRRCMGMTPAAIAAVVNLAAIRSVRSGTPVINQEHMLKAIETHRMGEVAQGGACGTESVRRRVAVHEAGHAVASVLLNMGKLEKVSLLPRGSALGVTMITPEEERRLVSQTQLEHQLQMLLAGRVAERLVLGDVSSGAADDLNRASEIALSMVTDYGMSSTGLVSFRAIRSANIVVTKVDPVVAANVLMMKAEENCTKILRACEKQLKEIADAVFENEEIAGDVVVQILEPVLDRTFSEERELKVAGGGLELVK
ncbi:TPA: AAA family ATPase [Pseudomonas aeruginosa]|nr:AAA family ATPase [Pseudomonas aeruginosa]